MRFLFFNASAFNQDLSTWNITAALSMKSIFTDSGLSTANYDAVLAGWGSQAVQDDVVFGAGTIQYSPSAQSWRDLLVNTYNWTITDGGSL